MVILLQQLFTVFDVIPQVARGLILWHVFPNLYDQLAQGITQGLDDAYFF
jgi:hypothetical protein